MLEFTVHDFQDKDEGRVVSSISRPVSVGEADEGAVPMHLKTHSHHEAVTLHIMSPEQMT